MEMHVFDRDLVDRGFDPGDQGQDGDRLLCCSVPQFRRADPSHHVQETAGSAAMIAGFANKPEA